jgi:transcriptional regulator with XRE-family HTH domain
MTSPYVRRRRLAHELRKLREDRDLTTDQVAKLVFQSRSKISKLENAQLRPDLGEVVTLLEALDVTGRQYDRIFQLAREAARKGWWDRYANAMGPRQRLYADLESGAQTIRDYNQTGIPTLLQTSDLIDSLVELDREEGPLAYLPARMSEARVNRQRQLLSADGPDYETILDEVVIRRLDVPIAVMIEQLRHMVALVSAETRITVRVLPALVRIVGGLLPKSSFALFTFPNETDPPMAVVDTTTTDLIFTEPHELARYTREYDRLCKAALSPDNSLAFISEVADQFAQETGHQS